MRFILATGSPTRQEIFTKLGCKFEVHVTHIDETVHPDETMEQAVERLAAEKAEAAFAEFSEEENVVVIAFDSLVEIEKKVLGKPNDEKEALKWFKEYKGKRVDAFSGVGIAGKKDGEYFHSSFLEKSWIHFRKDYSLEEIKNFLAVGDWEGKAGAITVEGAGAWLVEKNEGSFPNILGVPVIRLGQELRELGLDPLEILYNK